MSNCTKHIKLNFSISEENGKIRIDKTYVEFIRIAHELRAEGLSSYYIYRWACQTGYVNCKGYPISEKFFDDLFKRDWSNYVIDSEDSRDTVISKELQEKVNSQIQKEKLENELKQQNKTCTRCKEETQLKKVRLKNKLLTQISFGYYPKSIAPIGYIKGSRPYEHNIVIDNEYAPFVKRAYELFAEEDITIHQLGKRLYQEGWRNPYNEPFITTRIKHILQNLTYTGEFEYKGKIYKGSYDPIISKELFDKVQLKIEELNARKKQKESTNI